MAIHLDALTQFVHDRHQLIKQIDELTQFHEAIKEQSGEAIVIPYWVQGGTNIRLRVASILNDELSKLQGKLVGMHNQADEMMAILEKQL
jgi:hypothetical protein